MKRLLLISNSTLHGGGYLDYCADLIRAFLGPRVQRVLFVPYALADREGYAAKVRARLSRLGLAVDSVHSSDGPDGPRGAVERAEAVFVGGGNTFRLLAELHAHGLIEAIRARCAAGMPYLGASAGTNVACPTIKTTNDMPIVEPPTFDALGLVPFQVNPHYQDPDPSSVHMGETREQRILEFHEMNSVPVVGLREGSWIRVEGASAVLAGARPARVFRKGLAPVEHPPGARLDALLST